MIHAPSSEAWCSSSRACSHTAPPRPVRGLSRLCTSGMPHHASVSRANAPPPVRRRKWRANANGDERAGRTVAPEPLAGPEGGAAGPQDDLWIHTGLVLLLGGLMPSLVGTQFLDEARPLASSVLLHMRLSFPFVARCRNQFPRESGGVLQACILTGMLTAHAGAVLETRVAFGPVYVLRRSVCYHHVCFPIYGRAVWSSAQLHVPALPGCV